MNPSTPQAQSQRANSGASAPTAHPTFWDGFEHILMFTLLYSAAFSFSMLVHSFIDKWVPGISSYGSTSTFSAITTYWDEFTKTLLRGYIASLLVSFPLFAVLYLNIQKRTRVFPILKTFRLRKFFVYLTLYATFSIAIGSLGHILYTVISGNYTTNALLHFLTTTTVTGAIFARFMVEVLEDRYPYV